MLDPAGGRYITVPALAQQYTQGLTLWTHNLFREQALADRGAVDLAGLRRAREEFEHVITEARNRKRLNVRVARGRTGGAPAGSLAQAPGGAVPVGAAPAGPAPAAAPARRAALEARLAGQTTEAPGWKFGAPARRRRRARRAGPGTRWHDGDGPPARCRPDQPGAGAAPRLRSTTRASTGRRGRFAAAWSCPGAMASPTAWRSRGWPTPGSRPSSTT